MASHTPGPWKNDEGLVTGIESRQRLQRPKGSWPYPSIDIFDASDWPDELTEEAQANARLIAAAPELLLAAKKALNYIHNTESELGITLSSGDDLRSAISLAEIGVAILSEPA